MLVITQVDYYTIYTILYNIGFGVYNLIFLEIKSIRNLWSDCFVDEYY
jgi:hypothetical protein